MNTNGIKVEINDKCLMLKNEIKMEEEIITSKNQENDVPISQVDFQKKSLCSKMEHDISCEVCFLEYNDTTVIPLVLDCGHSFCESCIARLVICQKCRAEIPTDKTFPVNCSFISLIEEYKKTNKDDTLDITCRIQNLREKLSRIQNVKEKLSSFSSIETDLKSLSSVSEDYSTEGLTRKRKATKELKEMEKKYKKLFMNIANLENLDIIPTFSLLQRGKKRDFLQEVYKALKNSEKVFAMKSIDRKFKFGEVMVRDNKILIYSLTSEKIPDGAKTVLFQDLKDCMGYYRMHTFLEITGRNGTSHLIIIELQDLKSCPTFIKLCTGESGPSYHGKSYTKYDVRLCSRCGRPCSQNRCNNCDFSRYNPTLLSLEMLEKLPTDYCKNSSTSVACIINEIILIERFDDGFELHRVNYEDSYYIMGKVIYPSDICEYILPIDDNSQTPKILGCGIILEL